MSGFVQTIAAGVQDAKQVPAIAKVSPNTRVSATSGTLGTVADVLQFPGGPPPASVVGNWLTPNTRTQVSGLPTISVSSIGNAYSALGVPTGPLTVKTPDSRVSAQ